MAGNKIVSIIIPTRNVRTTVADLIVSITQQSYRPMEVVIIDGGSTDGTIDILEEIKRKNEEKEFKLKILKEEASLVRSPANVRNIGILDSLGEYIIFLDADMFIIDKDFVEKVRYTLDDNSWVRVKARPMFDAMIEKALVADSLTSGNYGHWFCEVRRELFKERLFDTNLGFAEDADFF